MKIEIELPDNCLQCGGRLTLPLSKRKKGDSLIVERPCIDCRKLNVFTVSTLVP